MIECSTERSEVMRKILLIVSVLFLFPLVIVGASYSAFNFGRKLCSIMAPARDGFGGEAVKIPAAVDRSYVLFSPFIYDQFLEDPGTVYLTDVHGRVVHSWQTKHQVLYSSLRKNGNLVVALIRPGDHLAEPGGGGTGIIQEINWNGEVVWQYENQMLHHDFDVLPNGGIAGLVWEKMTPEMTVKIKGGKNTSHTDFWSDSILEIDSNGKEVWRWSAAENLDIGKYELSPLVPRNEWTHGNSVRYYETNPFTGRPAYLLSFRHLSRVFLVDRVSGDVLWESQENMFAAQHDATLLDSGNVLAFDNGLFRVQERPGQWSRVIEVDPRTNKIVWEFNGGKTGIEKAKFSSSIMSGAQRLRNGNTFMVSAVTGHFFEVARSGEIVWDFVNPHLSLSSGPFKNNTVFKARRYAPEDVDWPKDLPDPVNDAVVYFCGN